MNRFDFVKLRVLKILIIGFIGSVAFSCMSDYEMPPSTYKELAELHGLSSSLLLSSSSSVGSSSSVEAASSSSELQPSSSSAVPSSSSVNLCASFTDDTTIPHYGQDKLQFCDKRDGNKYVYVVIGAGSTAQTSKDRNSA
ncbi:MAG: hypothetical protein FWC26_04850 [Fibromonadales bacterium]|nr:hypothetical protein [Fibromonadales bacterium]